MYTQNINQNVTLLTLWLVWCNIFIFLFNVSYINKYNKKNVRVIILLILNIRLWSYES